MSFLDAQEKVTDYLIAEFPGVDITAVLVPVTEFKEIKATKVFTIPFEATTEILSRSKTQKVYTIQIGIIQKVNSVNLPTTVLDFVEEVAAKFHNQNLPVPPAAPEYHSVGNVRNIPFYDYQFLDEDNVLISVVQVDYMEFVS